MHRQGSFWISWIRSQILLCSSNCWYDLFNRKSIWRVVYSWVSHGRQSSSKFLRCSIIINLIIPHYLHLFSKLSLMPCVFSMLEQQQQQIHSETVTVYDTDLPQLPVINQGWACTRIVYLLLNLTASSLQRITWTANSCRQTQSEHRPAEAATSNDHSTNSIPTSRVQQTTFTYAEVHCLHSKCAKTRKTEFYVKQTRKGATPKFVCSYHLQHSMGCDTYLRVTLTDIPKKWTNTTFVIFLM